MKKYCYFIPLLSVFFPLLLKASTRYEKAYLYLKNTNNSSFECRTKDPFWSQHLEVSSKDPIHPLAQKACSAKSKKEMKETLEKIIKHPEARRFIKLRVKSRWITWRGLKAILPDHIIHYDSVTPEEMLEKISG